MAFTNAWDESYPPGTLSADQIDTAIQYWAVAIRERMNSLLGIGNWASTGDPILIGSLAFSGATPGIIGGSASFIFRDNANANTNLTIADIGDITARRHFIASGNLVSSTNLVFNAASAKILPGSVSLLIRDFADANTNVSILDSGDVALRSALSVGGVTTLARTIVTGAQGYIAWINSGNTGAGLTIDWNAGNNQAVTLTANWTPILSNPMAGAVYILELTQDGTGSRTITWPANVHWPNGTAPTLTLTAGRTDIVTLYYNGTYYRGAAGGFNYV